ncbi:hypothetical protein HNV12_01975 [Methanococcoides sp. SA1]|nr:hypothetical protein [Methanococcoides sp. SA1]
MKVQDLINELQATEHYLCFKEQNKDPYFAAAFLILDLEKKTEQIQLDYFLPSENKIVAFAHPWEQPKIHDNIISVQEGKTEPAEVKPMAKQTTQIKIDIDDLEEKSNQLIKENNSQIKPTKIIAILKDDLWNLTCMDNALGIVRIKISPITEELIDFNKGSLMDFMGMKKS